jgi:7,8-dihydro-6-hydroxymethylpterin-pyrophosphokinase
MGDRMAMIEQACKEMEASGKIKVLRTSSLWETKAMYVVDQDMFVNGACEVRPPTSLALSILTSADRDVIGPDAVARQAPGC